MKIGIDIDDTIVDTHAIVKFYKELEYPDMDPNIELPEGKFLEYIGKYLDKIHLNAKAKPNVSNVLKELKNLGFEIIIITLRENEEEKIRNTKINLKKNDIIYDSIYFGVVDKGKLARELNIDLFIDDRLVICKQMKENNIKVIKIKKPSEIQNEFIEFDNWNEILKYIKENVWKE